MADEVKSIIGRTVNKTINKPAENIQQHRRKSYNVHLDYEDKYEAGYKIGFERYHTTHYSPRISFDELITLRDMINEELAKFEIDG